jgi:DNA primase
MSWIDFKHLRDQIDFADLLRHHGVSLKVNTAGQHHGRCPLPTHPEDNVTLSFSANMRKKIWRCFSCGASGNCLDFTTRMDGGNPDNPADVRKAAAVLIERLNLSATVPRATGAGMARGTPATPTPPKAQDARADVWDSPPGVPPQSAQKAANDVQETLFNTPLDFELKNLDADHVYLRKRGFDPKTIKYFGLGYCSKGMFAGRIAIPLHDESGKLVGYAGKLSDEFDVTPESPTYLWPTERQREGRKLIFDAGQLLYNGHKIKEMAPLMDLVITSDFHSVWHLHQVGVNHVVGTMSDTISKEQAKQVSELVRPTGRIWLLAEASKEGKRYAQSLFGSLGHHRFCRWVRLASGRPIDRGSEGLRDAVQLK